MARRAFLHRQQGQAALFMTMTITVSMGWIGLVVDFGWAYWRREACATAANSAAFAAALAASSDTNHL
jgi:Flp pilus assembly protein TadG